MRKGFTLIELVIVIVIIGILAGAMIPMFTSRTDEARKAKAQTELEAIRTAATLYRADLGSWPAGVSNLTSTEGKGPYLDKVGDSPWGSSYGQYEIVNNTTSVCAKVKNATTCADNCVLNSTCSIQMLIGPR